MTVSLIREKAITPKFTSYNKFGSFRDERILDAERTGSDLTLPDPIIIFKIGIQDPKRAVAIFRRRGPLVLVRVDADRGAVLLPAALALLVQYDAGKNDRAPRVDLLVPRLLGPLLQSGCSRTAQREREQHSRQKLC